MGKPIDKLEDPPDRVLLGKDIHFSAYGDDSLISQVLFITGKRGSGKSWTAAVLMEEFARLGLQFVCFDALDAHGHLAEDMEGVVPLKPTVGQTINMTELVETLKTTSNSVIIKLAGLPLKKQQDLIADYCEALLEAALGKGIQTIIEECQDFIPQMGRPSSADPIIRLCKLGRALGYGVTLISQRPAGVGKEALSQASIYLVHNVINARDLKALDDQLSFGTDKKTIKRMLDGIAKARKGEVIAYAPEFYRDRGYVVVGKIRADRKTEHKGHNVNIQDARRDFQDVNTVASTKDLESLDVEVDVNPNHKRGMSAEASWRTPPPTTPSLKGNNSEQLLNDMSWDSEPDDSPQVEYDVSVEPPEPEKESSFVVTGIVVGGLVVAGTLSYVVYRGLSS
jgi:hypothetical protein|tara:strand:+ start:2390 stop:3577 length:1188 start_codon:yes stop_codon:yes gene_type:complete